MKYGESVVMSGQLVDTSNTTVTMVTVIVTVVCILVVLGVVSAILLYIYMYLPRLRRKPETLPSGTIFFEQEDAGNVTLFGKLIMLITIFGPAHCSHSQQSFNFMLLYFEICGNDFSLPAPHKNFNSSF